MSHFLCSTLRLIADKKKSSVRGLISPGTESAKRIVPHNKWKERLDSKEQNSQTTRASLFNQATGKNMKSTETTTEGKYLTWGNVPI